MKRYLMTISYNGTNYSGWQSQNNSIAVQKVVEDCIEKITSKKVSLFASGRTDSGVHAENQKAHFDMDKNIECCKFVKSLNSVLPDDIVIKEVKPVNSNFHARYNVKKKTYVYRINNGYKDVFFDDFELFVPKKLDIKKMKQASKYLKGTHNFSAFCSSKTNVNDFVRTIYYVNFCVKDDKITIKICGNGFLYNMVRIIVGTLIEIGQGKKQPKDMKVILESRDRNIAGKTAKAKGLTLFNVEY